MTESHARAAFFCTLLVIGTPASAKESCVTFAARPPAATITLYDGTWRSSSSPASWCDLQRGRTRALSVSHPGYERRVLKFRLDSAGRAHFSGRRLSFTARAFAVPGWGLAALGFRGQAFSTFVAVGVTGAQTLIAWDKWDRAKLRRDQLIVEAPGPLSAGEAAALAQSTRDADRYRDYFYASGALAGWLQLGSIVESFYRASPPNVKRTDEGSWTLSTPRASGVRTAVQSALWPGTGQYYRGSPAKGFLFQSAFTAGAMLTLDRWLLYRLRDSDYIRALGAIDGATTASEREALRLAAARVWDDREARRRQVIGWAGVTAGVWLLNVIDAAGSSAGGDFPGRFEPQTTVRGGSVYQGFRMRF